MSFSPHLLEKISVHLKRTFSVLLSVRATPEENEKPSLPDYDYQMFKDPVAILSEWFYEKTLREQSGGCEIFLVLLFNQNCEPYDTLTISKYCQLAQELSESYFYREQHRQIILDYMTLDSKYRLQNLLKSKNAEQLIELLEDTARWQLNPQMKVEDFKCPDWLPFHPLKILLGSIIAVLVHKNVKYQEIVKCWKNVFGGGTQLAEHMLLHPPPKVDIISCPPLPTQCQTKIIRRSFDLLPKDAEILSMNSSITISSEILRFSWEYFNNFLKCHNDMNECNLTDEDVQRGIKYKIDLGRRLTPDTLHFLRSYFYKGLEEYDEKESLPLMCLGKFGEELRLFDHDQRLSHRTHSRYPHLALFGTNYVYAMVWGIENDSTTMVDKAIKSFDERGWKSLGSTQKEWILAQPDLYAELAWRLLIRK